MFPASQTKMKSLWVLGDFYTVKISGDETGGRYSVWEIEVAPNNGPPLHKHTLEDEAFYILEGEYSFPYASGCKLPFHGQLVSFLPTIVTIK